jgi:hypothetical protein
VPHTGTLERGKILILHDNKTMTLN